MANGEHGEMGHNLGVVDPELLEELRDDVNRFGAEAIRWGERGVDSDAAAEDLTDFISAARALYKRLDEKRVEAKKPFDDAGKQIQATFKPLLDAMIKAGNVAKELQGDYLRKKKEEAEKAAREAQARAEAERQAEIERAKAAEAAGNAVEAAEAEARAKEAAKAAEEAAKPAKVGARSASGSGRTVSLRKVRRPVIKNRIRALAHYQNDPDVIDAVLKAAARDIRAGERDIPGIEIEETEVAA